MRRIVVDIASRAAKDDRHQGRAERLRQLLDVGRSLTAELDLDVLLGLVKEAACELCGAAQATIEARGDQYRDPEPLVAEARAGSGRAPIRGFLAVPIVVRGQPWGTLCLAEKQDAADFDDEDREAIAVLAEWAAIAIDHASLFGTSERRRVELERAARGLQAAGDIALALGDETDLERVLELIVDRARALVDADALLIWLADEGVLRLAAHAGHVTPPSDTEIPFDGSTSGAALRSRQPIRITDASTDLLVGPAQFGLAGAHSALLVPLIFRGQGLGVLAAFDHLGQAVTFSEDDERALRTFAASAATAVATARTVEARRLRDSIGAAEGERRRWARNLHDETLQGLGAMKLGLSAALRADPATARRQVEATVAQLEREITSLRGIIADLRPPALDELGLEPALRTLATRAGELHGIRLELLMDLGERRLDADVETIAYRVGQEALTNVVKHAHATCVWLELRATASALELRVRDDGRGLAAAGPRRATGYGITGMRERAEIAGGRLCIEAVEGGGTTVALTLPLRS